MRSDEEEWGWYCHLGEVGQKRRLNVMPYPNKVVMCVMSPGESDNS